MGYPLLPLHTLRESQVSHGDDEAVAMLCNIARVNGKEGSVKMTSCVWHVGANQDGGRVARAECVSGGWW